MNDNIIEEIWKEISNYEGLYEVSSLGRVKSLERYEEYSWKGQPVIRIRKEKIMTTSPDQDGYQLVSLGKGGERTTKKVHRLVAEAFIKNNNNLPFVNHKDEVKYNNRADNLEWCTAKYNTNYNDLRKRIAKKQSKPVVGTHIITGKKIEYPSVSSAMRDGYTHVSEVIHGRRKYDKEYIWEFA